MIRRLTQIFLRPVAILVLAACVSATAAQKATAAWPLDEAGKALLGIYAIEAETAGDGAQCLIMLLEPPVTEIEGVWHVARPRLDQPNLEACAALGVGHPIAWSTFLEDRITLLAMGKKPSAWSAVDFIREGTDGRLFRLKQPGTGIRKSLMLIMRRVGDNED
jgi:hypothetical protein